MTGNDDAPLTPALNNDPTDHDSADHDQVQIEGVTVDTSTVGQSDDFPDEQRKDVNVSTNDFDVDHSKPS